MPQPTIRQMVISDAKDVVGPRMPSEFWARSDVTRIIEDAVACYLALVFLAEAFRELGAQPVATKGKAK